MRLYAAKREVDSLTVVAIDDSEEDLKATMGWLNFEGAPVAWEVNSPEEIANQAKALVTRADKATVLILVDDHLPIATWGQQVAVTLSKEGYLTAILSGSADPGSSAEVHKQENFVGWYHPKDQQGVAMIKRGLDASKQRGEIDPTFFPRTSAVDQFSVLKHGISHIFLPLDVDLQGLRETGFREDYWEEVVQAWGGTKAVDTLHQLHHLLREENQDNVKEVVKDAIAAILRKATANSQVSVSPDNLNHLVRRVVGLVETVMKDKVEDLETTVKTEVSGVIQVPEQKMEMAYRRIGNIMHAWQKVRSISEPSPDVLQILQDLGNRNKRHAVQEKCKGGSNPFHEWFVQLDEALDELRQPIENASKDG